ncbi:MAG: di-heme oxidoredictase family protein [Planctomycetota bacterium]
MRTFSILATVFGALLIFSYYDTSSADVDADVVADFGEPIPGLSAFGLFQFEAGRDLFKRRFTRSEGLGPHFNATSCQACHEDPAAGGSSQRYRDFFLAGTINKEGGLDKLYPDCTTENRAVADTETCLPSLVLPHYGPKGTIENPVAPNVEHPAIPAHADVVARRNAPPMFGVGLFRLVSDSEILLRADPHDVNKDGISGRVNRISSEDDAIGRFGFKCQTASIEAFNRGALMNQMGITSDSTEMLDEVGSALPSIFEMKTAHAQVAEPRDRIVDYDDRFDPEIRRGQLLQLIFFQENLAAPPRGEITPAVRRGETIFADIGCTSCHTPTLNTSIGCIHPYTDLLIHDMGPGLADGIRMEDASGSEFRTQPLWGLCQHRPFLHDGRADTVVEAILEHGGEAQASRDAFAELPASDKNDLLRFLESL